MRLTRLAYTLGLALFLSLTVAAPGKSEESAKQKKTPPISGFLGDYSDLQPHPDTSIEAEFLDSQTGERLVAVVAERKGKRFGGKVKGAKTWGDVKAAFKQWSKNLRQQLEKVHAE